MSLLISHVFSFNSMSQWSEFIHLQLLLKRHKAWNYSIIYDGKTFLPGKVGDLFHLEPELQCPGWHGSEACLESF